MASKIKADGLKLVKRIDLDEYQSIIDLNKELQVLLAIGYLNGATKQVHTEELAVQLFEWLPKIYGWKMQKYQKYPDKETMRRSLMNLRLYEWVRGAVAEVIEKDGWELTTTGLEVYKKINHLHDRRINPKISEIDKNYLKKRIANSKLYKIYLHSLENSTSFTVDEFTLSDFLEVSHGMEPQIRSSFFGLLNKSKDSEMETFIDFLEGILQQHQDLLDESKFIFENRQKKPKRT
jgi:hypothetical protein